MGYRIYHKKLYKWSDTGSLGTGPIAFYETGFISRYAPIYFYISCDAKQQPIFMGKPVLDFEKANLSSLKHYVIILADSQYKEIRQIVSQLGFRDISDCYDWFGIGGGIQKVDIEYKGIPLGRYSGFPFPLTSIQNYIKEIGRFTRINPSTQINANHSMNFISTTGAFKDVFTGDHKEMLLEMSDDDRRRTNRKVSIGNDVWIGANVFINASRVASIGDGAIIGSSSLVLDDIPPYAIAYGTPAQVQRYRFTPEQIEILLRIKWWEWDDKTIDKNTEMLIYPEKFFEKFLSEKP